MPPSGSQTSKCILCFSSFANTRTEDSSCLYKTCCKYLHSGIMSGLVKIKVKNRSGSSRLQEGLDEEFCEKCFKSANELAEVIRSLKMYQKRLAKMTVLFSVEILQRRGLTCETRKTVKNKDEQVLGVWGMSVNVSPLFEDEDGDLIDMNEKGEDTESECYFETADNIKLEEVDIDEEDGMNEDPFLDDASNTSDSEQNSAPKRRRSANQTDLTNNKHSIANMNKGNASDSSLRKSVRTCQLKMELNNGNHGKKFENQDECKDNSDRVNSSNSELTATSNSINGNHKSVLSGNARAHGAQPARSNNYSQQSTNNLKKGEHRCSLCKKEFRHKFQRVIHEKTHSGENCRERSGRRRRAKNTSTDLIAKKTATGYLCPVCDKHITCKSNMERHFRTHTGDKPYQCDQCSFSFAQSSNLKKHKAYIHSSDSFFKCAECGKGYSRLPDIRKHYKIDHSDIEIFPHFT